MMSTPAIGRVIAVLGPTNTGKTHLALERMLGHRSGMIGFPLRLLARENYDRIVRLKGKASVALLTGEEKIIPPHPRWFVCTVESMPLDRRVDFLAIDEIQLCADPDRGHVFTDRLLHARGESETMFLGAETIKPLIRRLVSRVEFITRPRFSQLSYQGQQKLTRLPARSAVVAFSAADVYALAELIRRQKGGAAVVLGALSPRTRNAQVGLYQAGEVDYLVATDAIGMGLNMDVDHVAFAALRKFDGRVPRSLESAEVAQIAGRAGRHMNDGTFGTTGDIGGIDPMIVEAVENHSFPPLKRLQWRNSDLRFTSVAALLASLNRLPDDPGLIRARDADDQLVLQALAADPEILARAAAPARVKLLWDVCQVPDFRKTLAEQHSRLLGVIFRHLTGPAEKLPGDWLDQQIKRLDRTDGDMDTLMTRIANIRTWTYVSHRADWLDDAVAWQERARGIEDRLSDALHERLTQRFVDRRTTMLTRKLKDNDVLASEVEKDGDVRVEGHFVGSLHGFQFRADHTEGASATRAVALAAHRALRPEIASRVSKVATEPDAAFRLDGQGLILWQNEPLARLTAGATALTPTVEILPSDLIDQAARELLHKRLDDWLDSHLRQVMAPIFAALAAPLPGAARGLAFQLGEGLGSVPRAGAEQQVTSLTDDARTALARLDVRLGRESIFLPRLLKPAAQALRGLLWAVHRNQTPFPPPPPGRIAVPVPQDRAPASFEAMGFRPLNSWAVRVDMLERFTAEVRRAARAGAFPVTPALAALLGLSPADAGPILQALGYLPEASETGPVYRAVRRRPAGRRRTADRMDSSPFAALRDFGRG
ncbi:helicase-related protein [Telmatospirillum sp.]|uniref:helicase-related protein n=1 Tax=Telmatospirillum sp. TaxID=2079197 RepID=UPI0028447A4D|nr:helicase-related protein [Telmatospirillum sp.]MDR3440244.1 helicase-related protein [Telmatospirillum sp.]